MGSGVMHAISKLNRKTTDPRRASRSGKTLCCNDSGDRTRTCDPLINSQLLYQLSYAGLEPRWC